MKKKKKIEKKDFYLVESDQTIAFILSYYNLHLFHYFLFLLFFILYHYLHHFYYL